ncbi:uncharacterized protein LOC129612639 isoform X2 [Condylostylus longicornis]|uniref:uncharacterized protein LOC129612639 isoform X2 n=1 Tax=Condylostylus longicornis TaxID=2530218 RepID=UPI00244E3693|nr:uncharacterized protein LOC129612639 isoform X2 [Condylostylus longicornis]
MKTKLEDRPTKTQRRLLIQHMKDTRHIEGKGKDRKYQWQKITMELNAIGPPKDVAQWKKQWQNLRLSTRKKLQEISRRHPGSPIPELNEEDNEIMEIEASQADSHYGTLPQGQGNNVPLVTNFKQENMSNYNTYNMDYQQQPIEQYQPSTSQINAAATNQEVPIPGETTTVKVKRKYKKRIKKENIPNDDNTGPQNYIQPKTKLSMEIKSRTYKGMCEIAKHGKKKKKHMDSDELFLMSFVGELKKIPEYKKLEVKSDIIAIFKKWSTKTQETQVSPENIEESNVPQPIEVETQPQEPHREKLFELEKPFNQRPVSQQSQNSNSLGGPSSPLNLQQTNQNQQNNSNHHFNVQHNSLLHSVQQLIPLPQQQNLQQLQHQQQQQQPLINQHHGVNSLPTQHFPIYQRYGNL